jgi:hypothetical protein
MPVQLVTCPKCKHKHSVEFGAQTVYTGALHPPAGNIKNKPGAEGKTAAAKPEPSAKKGKPAPEPEA